MPGYLWFWDLAWCGWGSVLRLLSQLASLQKLHRAGSGSFLHFPYGLSHIAFLGSDHPSTLLGGSWGHQLIPENTILRPSLPLTMSTVISTQVQGLKPELMATISISTAREGGQVAVPYVCLSVCLSASM